MSPPNSPRARPPARPVSPSARPPVVDGGGGVGVQCLCFECLLFECLSVLLFYRALDHTQIAPFGAAGPSSRRPASEAKRKGMPPHGGGGGGGGAAGTIGTYCTSMSIAASKKITQSVMRNRPCEVIWPIVVEGERHRGRSARRKLLTLSKALATI